MTVSIVWACVMDVVASWWRVVMVWPKWVLPWCQCMGRCGGGGGGGGGGGRREGGRQEAVL